jgi:hypothetical protein
VSLDAAYLNEGVSHNQLTNPQAADLVLSPVFFASADSSGNKFALPL